MQRAKKWSEKTWYFNAKKSRRKMVSKQIIFTLRRKKIYWAYARASCRSFKRKIDSNGKDLSKQRRFLHTSCSAAIACFLSKPEAACWQNVRLTSPKLRFRTAVGFSLVRGDGGNPSPPTKIFWIPLPTKSQLPPTKSHFSQTKLISSGFFW